MDPKHKECVKCKFNVQAKNITLDDKFFALLMGKQVITPNEYRQVKLMKSNRGENEAKRYFLNDILPACGSKAFNNYLLTLKDSGHDCVVEELLQWLRDENGPIPPQFADPETGSSLIMNNKKNGQTATYFISHG